jgi:hypothetical protein
MRQSHTGKGNLSMLNASQLGQFCPSWRCLVSSGGVCGHHNWGGVGKCVEATEAMPHSPAEDGSSTDSGQAPSDTVLRQCLLMEFRPASNSRSSPHDPPTSSSRVAGIIAMCHHSQPSVYLSRFRGFCLNAVSRATN